MKVLSDKIKNYTGENPFGDYQGRNFSDKKISSEFYPISCFWSLFNAQHEILIGSRGSGKTFLLKMMRYSMLKKIDDSIAQKYVSSRKYIALYVPMHLEFVVSFLSPEMTEKQQILLFQIAFNCLLAQSLISELKALIEDIEDELKRKELTVKLTKKLNEVWFNDGLDYYDFSELHEKINKVYYNIDLKNTQTNVTPTIFTHKIGSSLLSVKSITEQILGLNEPTWIICVDEAEFLNTTLQRCINDIFRSDSNRIALKIATLPFYHTTLDTLCDGISVSEGNDFNYRVIDMDYESKDFINLTNRICSERLKMSGIGLNDLTLEDFVGVVGNDDLIDYYKKEVGEENATYDIIKSNIIASFSEKKQKGITSYDNERKTIYDKYSTIYFTREMYKKSLRGNSKPGWYAGARTIRKVTQGNPRMFIHIMNNLFEKALGTTLTPKAQHEVICKYADSVCTSTIALESTGPIIHSGLCNIASILHERVHENDLIACSSSFILKYANQEQFEQNKRWIELAIAHSRLIVDNDQKKGLSFANSKLCLGGAFSVKYWLPMRKDTPATIKFSDVKFDSGYEVKITSKRIKRKQKNSSTENVQLSLLQED